MKKLILSTLFCAIVAITFAQPPHGQHPSKEQFEKMKAHKATFITNELKLTAEEAQNFWPIYNEMDEKLHQLREKHRTSRENSKIENMNDTEIEKTIEEHFNFRQQELNLEKEYAEKFKKVLPVNKVAELHRAEQNFHRELIQKLGEKKQGPPPHKN